MRVTGDETQGTMGRRKRGSEAFVPSRLPSRANLYQQRDVWERGTQSGYLHRAEDVNTHSASMLHAHQVLRQETEHLNWSG